MKDDLSVYHKCSQKAATYEDGETNTVSYLDQ